jgi:putative oxidoreductase
MFARGLMALIFLIAGLRKALAFAATVGYFGKLGIPVPEVVVIGSICIEIGGAILLTIGYKPVIVASIMAAFTLGAALIAHQFWTVSDPQAYGAQLNNFLKNVAMVGGFLMVIVAARRVRT